MGVRSGTLGAWLIVALVSALGGVAGCVGAQASCNQMRGTSGACQEYSGTPGSVLDSFQTVCDRASGIWSTTGCPRTGSTGECRQAEATAVITSVYYSGSVDAQRSACTAGGGSWSGR